MKRVLILYANQRSALAATRSLGRHGIHIITADETADSLAGSSRYSKLYFRYPSPRIAKRGQIKKGTDLFFVICGGRLHRLCGQQKINLSPFLLRTKRVARFSGA